jgi:hypothetical protein
MNIINSFCHQDIGHYIYNIQCQKSTSPHYEWMRPLILASAWCFDYLFESHCYTTCSIEACHVYHVEDMPFTCVCRYRFQLRLHLVWWESDRHLYKAKVGFMYLSQRNLCSYPKWISWWHRMNLLKIWLMIHNDVSSSDVLLYDWQNDTHD